MKRRLKACLSALLAAAMLLSLLPGAAFAAGETGTFTKITTQEELTNGKYVMVVDSGYAVGALDGTWLTATQVTDENGSLTNPDANLVWNIAVTDGGVTLTDANGVQVAPKGGNSNGIQAGDYTWGISFSGGTFRFLGTGEDTVTLASNKRSDNKFRAYKNTTINNGYPCDFTLYKLAGGGEQRFALRGKRVGLLAALARDDQAVMLERGLLAEEGVDRLIRDGEQLRRLEGEGLAHVHQEILRLGAHGLVIGVAGVLVRAAERIVDKLVAGRVDGIDGAQEAEQIGGAFAETPFIGSGVRHKAAHRLQLFIPRLVGGVHIGNGPGELRIDLTAGRNGFCHDTSLLFIIKIAVPGRQGRAHAPSAAGGGCTAVVL